MTFEEPDADVLARSIAAPAAFATIYTRHGGQVLRYLRRRLGDAAAEDAATEVFVLAFRQRHGYVAQHPSALPWLFWLARRVIADHGRAEQRRLRLLTKLADAAERSGGRSDVPPGRLAPGVVRALRALSAPDREALLLVVWGELTYDEVAAATGVPVGTVRSRIARARKRLGDEMPIAALRAGNLQPGESNV